MIRAISFPCEKLHIACKRSCGINSVSESIFVFRVDKAQGVDMLGALTSQPSVCVSALQSAHAECK